MYVFTWTLCQSGKSESRGLQTPAPAGTTSCSIPTQRAPKTTSTQRSHNNAWFLQSPLFGALKPACRILTFTWSFYLRRSGCARRVAARPSLETLFSESLRNMSHGSAVCNIEVRLNGPTKAPASARALFTRGFISTTYPRTLA